MAISHPKFGTNLDQAFAHKNYYLKSKTSYLLTGGPFDKSKGNTKIAKSNGTGGYKTALMHLTPHKVAGVGNLCPYATSCVKGCLHYSGHGAFNSVQQARNNRTVWFMKDRQSFLSWLNYEIYLFKCKCLEEGVKPGVRLNGTSDVVWEKVAPHLFTEHPEVQFYDYTKIPGRKNLPSNYDLTFSRDEVNAPKIFDMVDSGDRVAVVFRIDKKNDLPKYWHGYPVYDGDKHDFRFLEPGGIIIGLRVKGKTAKQDTSGFVVDPDINAVY